MALKDLEPKELDDLFWSLADTRLEGFTIYKRLAVLSYLDKVYGHIPHSQRVRLVQHPDDIEELINRAGAGYDAFITRRNRVRAIAKTASKVGK